MPSITVGDLTQHLMLSRNTTLLKQRLNTLTEEMSSGEAKDRVAATGGDTKRLVDIDRQMKLSAAQLRTATDVGQRLAMTQNVLDGIDVTRNAMAKTLIPITSSANDTQRQSAAAMARTSLDSIMAQLNTRYGDQTLLAGNATDRAAVADADTLMADILSALVGAVTAQVVIDTIDDYFSAAGGGFETNIYQGDNGGPVLRPIGQGETVSISARADDPAIRGILAATVLASVVVDGSVSLTDAEQANRLLSEAGERLLTEAKPLADMQGNLGNAEAQIEEARVRASVREASLTMARNDLISADPFETATELQAVQLQLETHYALTARLARLSLTEYL